jgi:hypothetical protein
MRCPAAAAQVVEGVPAAVTVAEVTAAVLAALAGGSEVEVTAVAFGVVVPLVADAAADVVAVSEAEARDATVAVPTATAI